MTGRVRVLLADDDPLVGAAIAAILQPLDDVVLVARAADGRQAIELALKHRPDVTLLDIQMPVLDGLATLRELRRLLPDVPVVMLTTFGEYDYVGPALHSGAAGFLLKDSAGDELPQAVRAAAGGQAFLSPRVTRQVLDRLPATTTAAKEDREKTEALSRREREVLVLLTQGMSNAEISAQLYVSEGTVKTHLYRVFTKIGCDNRVQAAMFAQRNGLLDEGSRPA